MKDKHDEFDTTGAFVKGAVYTCGCVNGSDRLVPIVFIPTRCMYHGVPVEYYYKGKK